MKLGVFGEEMIKIKHRYTEYILWEGDADTIREAMIKALKDGANLRGAYLRGADLSDTNLRGADLSCANLSGANLRGADLDDIKKDLIDILHWAKPEIPGLYKALLDGKVDGSTYTGECSCLVGTIASVRKIDYSLLDHNLSRPAERWFLAIRKGDNPDNNPVSAIVRDWIEEYAKDNGVVLPDRSIVWEQE